MQLGSVKRVTLRMGLTTRDALREQCAAMRSSWNAVRLALLSAVFLVVVAAPVHGVVTCPTGVTHTGDSGDDDIIGTQDGDRIVTNGGDDIVHARGGSDCVNGGSFDDQLFGEADDDLLVGEGGNDFLDGGDGNDELVGGSNDDTLIGGEGNDKLAGEAGSDLLDGGDGNDELDGGTNNDVLIGGLGTDKTTAQGGDDTIIIHAGDVTVGIEEISGGDGVDTAVFDFDPGDVVPPNFDVVDPTTLAIYRFTDVERVVFEGCGNGTLGPGEQCDDGNLTPGDGCDSTCRREDCPNGRDENGECGPDNPNNEECGGPCNDGDKCTTDTCRNGRCVFTPLPALDRALCDINEIRSNCTLELSQRKRLSKKLRKVQRLLRLVKAGAAPTRLRNANRIIEKVQRRALKMVLRGQTREDCSKAIDVRLGDLSAAVATLQF